MKKINKYIQVFFDKVNNLNLLYIFLLANPILDLFTSLGINEQVPIIGSFGFLFRGIFLFFMIINIFFSKTKNRKKYICILGLIFCFYLMFNINGFLGFSKFSFFAEVKAFIKAFYLPMLFIGMLNYFDYAKEKELSNYKKIFNIIGITVFIYLTLILVPAIFGIGYKSYASAKQGVIGFFNSPNEIGTILAILSAIILNWISCFKNKFISFVLSFLFIYVCLIIGTKTPLLGIIIAIFINLLFIVISFIKTKDKTVLKKLFYPVYWIITVIVVLLCCSPLFSNLGWQSTLFDSNNKPAAGDDIPVIEENKPSSDEITNKPTVDQNKPSTGEENLKPEVQKPTTPNVDSNDKEHNNENISTDDKVDDNSNNDKTPSDDKQNDKEKEEKKRALELIIKKIKNLVFSSRDIYIEQGFTVFENSSITNKMFGLGNVSLKAGYKNTVEVDLFDILFNYGIIGFIIYFGILLWSVVTVIKNLIFSSKNSIRNSMFESCITSIMIGILIAFTAGHTMLAPAVSGYLALLMGVSCSMFEPKEKNNKLFSFEKFYKFSKKYIVVFIGSFLLICLFIIQYNINLFFNDKINIEAGNIKFSGSEIARKYELVDLKETKDFGVEDKTYIYHHTEKNIDLIYTHRSFENGSVGNFITIHNNSDSTVQFKLDMPTSLNASVYTFSDKEIVKEYSTTVGYDKMTLPAEYQEWKNNSILIGKTFNYQTKLLSYSEDNYSTYKDLISENNDLKKKYFTLYKEITIPSNSSIDTYYFESEKSLFNSEESINSYIGLLNSSRTSSWISNTGTYHKLPYSIEPYSKEAYGRNIGGMVEKNIYNLSEKDDSIIFEDIVLQSLLVYFNYMPRNDIGVWLTEYTSTWLKKDYGTQALYVDTRHNENLSLFLQLINNKLKLEQLEKASFAYADFLIYKYNENELINLKQGKLYPDYFADSNTKMTHASLNHQLAIANYLFASYETTNNKDYYNVAKKIIRTIEKIGNEWIKKNNDLWYEIKTDGTFSGEDYEELTLTDLLISQEYLLKYDNKNSKILDKLIKSKIKYLNAINYKISGFTVDKMRAGGYID